MEINRELIIKNEVENDGKTIHLYFNTEVGLYVAFGPFLPRISWM